MGNIIYPGCSHENHEAAIICSHCGRELPNPHNRVETYGNREETELARNEEVSGLFLRKGDFW